MIANLNDKDLGYIAGIIDGEGGILIKREKSGRLSVRLRVGTICEELANYLKEKIGYGYVGSWHASTSTGKPVYTYCIGGRDSTLIEVLSKILDGLIVKKEQISLVIEFLKIPRGERTAEMADKIRSYSTKGPKKILFVDQKPVIHIG